jgi:hypothetical protein
MGRGNAQLWARSMDTAQPTPKAPHSAQPRAEAGLILGSREAFIPPKSPHAKPRGKLRIAWDCPS